MTNLNTLQEALALHGFTLRDCHWEDVKMCKTSLNRNELHYCKAYRMKNHQELQKTFS